MEVAEPLVPVPVDVVLPCGEAHRLRDVEVEHVEAVGPAVHLDEEAPALVSDAKHSVLDLHLGSSFIELAKTHDGVAQRQYEVDAVKNVMLAILGLNTIEPTPWISTLEASPNRTEPCTEVSRSKNSSRHPAMWWVASLSRYQPLSMYSLPLLRNACALGSLMSMSALEQKPSRSVSSSRKPWARKRAASPSSACAACAAPPRSRRGSGQSFA